MNIETLRKTAPPVKKVETIDLQEPEHFLLDNGIPVYCIAAGDQEVLKMDIIYKSGASTSIRPAVPYITNSCMREGTKNFSSGQIAGTIDYYGATLTGSVTRDDARVIIFCLTRHFEQVLPVIGEIVLAPTFPEVEVKTITSRSKQEFLVELEKVSFLARRHFGKTIFGADHPYGTYAEAEDYDKISGEVLSEYYRKNYLFSTFRIIVSGRIPENIQHLLNGYFGRHQVSEISPQNFNHSTNLREKSLFIEKPDALQSGVVIGKTLFNMNHPDWIKMQVVNTIFGGYFGSRLMTNIREDKGYTYGINANLVSMQHAGLLYISTQVGNDVTQLAIDEVFKEIDRMRNEP
ncbi:MAG: insulinase family protein, partial [Bacteroidales bacterium]|nr:insulinase family protein [Bacteroidales bacterium]